MDLNSVLGYICICNASVCRRINHNSLKDCALDISSGIAALVQPDVLLYAVDEALGAVFVGDGVEVSVVERGDFVEFLERDEPGEKGG